MRSARLLTAAVLLAACGTNPIQARIDTLQNPRYPGDANRDLVPYQARNRDAADCVWYDLLPKVMHGQITVERFAEPEIDAAVTDAVVACMAGKGWR